MRIVVVTLGVLLSLVAVLLAVVAVGLFLDGDVGAGGLTVFFLMVTLLCALLLFRTVPRAAALPARRRTGTPSDTGFYYGDTTPAYGADRSWGGDGGADTTQPGHTSGGGWGVGSDGGSTSGSDGGSSSSGGSDGGSSGGSD